MPNLTPHAVRERIEPGFSRLETAITDFDRALKTERSALESGDMDALVAAAAPKEHSARQVAELARALLAVVVECGFAGTADGLRDCIRHAARADAGLATRREVLASLTARCEQDNQVHGRILATRRAAAEQALSIIFGGRAGSQAGAYDASGLRMRPTTCIERDVV